LQADPNVLKSQNGQILEEKYSKEPLKPTCLDFQLSKGYRERLA